jgi:septal ring-binding cell division protein DamX
MPDKKIAETKAVETAAPAEEKKTAAAKKPAEKKATVAKKPAEKKATAAKKPAEKKATAAKKPAAKKTAAAEERKVVIQYNGAEVAGTDLVDKAKADAGVKSAKSVVVYVRPEINKVYYVIDDNTFGNFDLF